MIRSLALIALLSARARAQEEAAPAPGAAAEVEGQDELARRTAQRLRDNPELQASLAGRILASSLAGPLAGDEPDRESAQARVAQWIAAHPEDAARLAIGFASDDENGTRDFDASLRERVVRTLRLNPDRYQGILGVLQTAGRQSRLIQKLGKKMDEEQERELLKRLFEGKGGEQGRVLQQPEPPAGRRDDSGSGGAVAGSTPYDRLSSLNPSGYSPEVLALQSALNAQRPPLAPKLVETGRLDYATLVFPAYALRAELARQESGLASRRAWSIARASGRSAEFTAEQYGEPAVQARLERSAGSLTLPPRLLQMQAALQRARAALSSFQSFAERMRRPSAIDRRGLKELSARQREASRWLLVASLQADLDVLDAESAFWTPELETLAKDAPAPEPTRRGFLQSASSAQARLAAVRARDESALSMLLADDYSARWGLMQRELQAGNGLRRGLASELALLIRIPAGLQAAAPAPAWRLWIDPWVCRLAPWSAWAQRAQALQRRRRAWSEAFALAAAGDFDRARRAVEDASQ